MPLTFRRRVRILPGVYLNISKRGVSLTHKVGPVSVNQRRGRTARVSVNGPGGFGWRTGGRSTRTRRSGRSRTPQGPAETPSGGTSPERPEMPAGGFDPYR